eukprot:scaffold1667_cov258-Pinguiococcus_pyrenoidosus.AAC.8
MTSPHQDKFRGAVDAMLASADAQGQKQGTGAAAAAAAAAAPQVSRRSARPRTRLRCSETP